MFGVYFCLNCSIQFHKRRVKLFWKDSRTHYKQRKNNHFRKFPSFYSFVVFSTFDKIGYCLAFVQSSDTLLHLFALVCIQWMNKLDRKARRTIYERKKLKCNAMQIAISVFWTLFTQIVLNKERNSFSLSLGYLMHSPKIYLNSGKKIEKFIAMSFWHLTQLESFLWENKRKNVFHVL